MPETDRPTDLAFIRRLQGQEEAAYRELVERWKLPVLNFVYRLTGDAAAADDLAQEVFVRISRKIGEYQVRESGDAFTAWLFQIARNAALDHLRHRRRHPANPADPQTDEFTAVPGNTPAPDRAVEQRETGEEIALAVFALPEDQRTALILAEYHEFPVARIAAVMNASEKAVESRLYRARQTLRQRLAHLLGDARRAS